MSECIAIVNPTSGGQSYTSVRKAAEYVRRGRAVIEDDMLRFLDRNPQPDGTEHVEAFWWNGSSRTQRMHRPGEVRS